MKEALYNNDATLLEGYIDLARAWVFLIMSKSMIIFVRFHMKHYFPKQKF